MIIELYPTILDQEYRVVASYSVVTDDLGVPGSTFQDVIVHALKIYPIHNGVEGPACKDEAIRQVIMDIVLDHINAQDFPQYG